MKLPEKKQRWVYHAEALPQAAGEGVTRRVLAYTDGLMCVENTFEKGAVGALHHHPHTQITYVVSGAFEFTVSWIMQSAFGIVAWDYSGTFLSIDGRTNFMFMCFWGILGVMWVKFLLPILLWMINKIPWKLRYALTVVCFVFMVVDVVLTVQTIDCWYLREAGHAPNTPLEEFFNKHYDNAYMEHRFQTMSMDPSQSSRV